MMREYTIKGNPVPQGRARSFIHSGTGKMCHLDPAKSVSWKNMVAWQIQNQHPDFYAEGPVFLRTRFYLKRPVSLPRRVAFHTKKPDADNLLKAVKDALKGVCWTDDSQVVKILTEKHYAEAPGSERVEIAIANHEF